MISFKNVDLANYLMFKLDKLENSFSFDELNKIDEVVIDGESDGIVNIKEIGSLNNLSSILIMNMFLSNDDISFLLNMSSLVNIQFEKCFFEDYRLLGKFNVLEMSLVNCDILDYSFLYDMVNLRKLTIINGEIDLSKINNLSNLNYLQLSYCNIDNIDCIDLLNLVELYIDNTNIIDLNILNNLVNLKIVSLSENQYLENKGLVENLEKKKVLVLNEGISSFDRGVLDD